MAGGEEGGGGGEAGVILDGKDGSPWVILQFMWKGGEGAVGGTMEGMRGE